MLLEDSFSPESAAGFQKLDLKKVLSALLRGEAQIVWGFVAISA